MSRIESGGKPTLQGWVDLAAMLEKLQMDRVALLLDGEPWKEKNSALQARDKACITLANKLSNGEVKVRQYLNRVIEIMGNYNLL